MFCDSPIYVTPKAAFKAVPVPCGRCPPCKHRRVNSWVFRLLQEEKRSHSSHFVTLTYDTSTVPISRNGYMTLQKSDFQKFMKRLRKLTDAKIRYFAAGEYGSGRERPHYHAIIFNVKDPQLYVDAWGLGFVHTGTVTGDSIAYTLKYIDKDSSRKFKHRDDRLPEFCLMSKGIGDNYLTPQMIDYHRSDVSRMCVVRPGGQLNSMPRFYRYKIFDESERKQQRLIAEQAASQNVKLLKDEFDRNYQLDGYTFDDWQESAKYARHTAFYKNQKNRSDQ